MPGEIEFDTRIFSGKNFLIVDDTEINLVLLDSIFKKWGVTADKARDGAQAFRLFGEKAYDMVLSDVYMPEMDGIELTHRIRKSGKAGRDNIPVIILTANIVQDEIEKFQLAGVTDYLMKPFHAKDLYSIVSKNL